MFFSVLFYWSGGGEKGFTEIRFVLQIGTFCFETPEHFVLRIIHFVLILTIQNIEV